MYLKTHEVGGSTMTAHQLYITAVYPSIRNGLRDNIFGLLLTAWTLQGAVSFNIMLNCEYLRR